MANYGWPVISGYISSICILIIQVLYNIISDHVFHTKSTYPIDYIKNTLDLGREHPLQRRLGVDYAD